MDPTNIIMFLLFFCVTGAIAVDPQAQKNQWNVLTGVTMWNGKPQHEFRINWFHLLCGALGAIVQEGWTLLQTARNQDLGSPGNPGTPQDARKSTNRNVRLYHCIANYIDKSCSIYRDAQLLFPDDGRALFNYIWHKGERAFTARQQIRREAKWKDASISALAIPIDEDTPITWKEWCLTEGRKLGKNLLEIRDKYLEGFPTSFDVVILAEKNSTANAGNGNFVRPANYAAHYPAALAGNADPLAGQPDMDALSDFLVGNWVDLLERGMIKAPPKGSVLQVRGEFDGPSDSARGDAPDPRTHRTSLPVTETPGMAYQVCPIMDEQTGEIYNQVLAISRGSIGMQTLCYWCGGRGHPVSIDGVVCASKQLGVKVPRELLEGTTYSDGITFPKLSNRPPTRRTSSTGAGSSSQSGRATVTVRTPRRGSGYTSTSEGKARETKVTAAPTNDPSSDSETDHAAHEVEFSMDLGGLQLQ